ncbi:MAG: hypothetical protein WCD86_02415 [Ktedonobacteraceae bacterium]
MALDLNSDLKTLVLNPRQYPGGIAIWGALPPAYDTSLAPPDAGVHIHTRLIPGGKKSIDETFDLVQVQLFNRQGHLETFTITGEDAASYNISTILKKRVIYLRCPHCQAVHADREAFAVTYHQRHHCEHCGGSFDSDSPCISNPVMLLKETCGDVLQERPILDPVNRKVITKQSKWPGGMQIWGSNPAILWTSPKLEEGGAHFHGFLHQITTPSADETFGVVSIDGILLDPEMVRSLMAQQALPHLQSALGVLDCPHCGTPHFDSGDDAVIPHASHRCTACKRLFASPHAQPVISNPLLRIRETLYANYQQLNFR